jgi:hypothetical protein
VKRQALNNRSFSSIFKGKVFTANQLLHVPHPLYSPDLALSDFRLFGHIKAGLARRSFSEPEELSEDVREFLEGIPADKLTAVSEGRTDQVRWVNAHSWQYSSIWLFLKAKMTIKKFYHKTF